MALTQIQKEITASIAGNRSDTSYIAGGVVLNMEWQTAGANISLARFPTWRQG